MPCYHPMRAYQCQVTKRVIFGKPPRDSRDITLPCGQCVGCRLERSRQWAVRCMHESQLWKKNCFITLTYDDKKLPPDYSCTEGLVYKHFQDFMKRFRKTHNGHSPWVNEQGETTYPIRFYMAGEYGENFGRPHFHACIFNFDFDDREFFKKSPSGEPIYISKKLKELWPFGFSSVGSFDYKSAAYVARYVMKKITGDAADMHYETFDPETGQVFWRTPEFNKMSLKPGIGADWLSKFASDVYPHDHVIVKGKECKPPRYYDKLIKRAILEPDKSRFEATPAIISGFDAMIDNRVIKAKKMLDDCTPERLNVREQVVMDKLSKLKRKLK